MRKWSRRLLVVGIVVVVAAASGSIAAYRATQWVPPFYARKLVANEKALERASEQLEEQLERIQVEHVNNDDDDHDDGDDEVHVWSAVLTEDQVNGWLAVNLRKKFPRLLPVTVREPRVAFAPGVAQIACQYVTPRFTAILSLDVDASATDQPNVVAVRLRNARMGAVPGLFQMARDEIDQAARRANIDLQWTEQDGDDVALVTIPEKVIDEQHQFALHEVEITDGQLRIAGQLVPLPDVPQPTEPAQVPESTRPEMVAPESISLSHPGW